MNLGIKSLTMDDVSREMGISKKTLYQFFENKDDLVNKCLEHHLVTEKEKLMRVRLSSENSIQELLVLTEAIVHDTARIKSNVLFELQKYHRSAWVQVHDFHHVYMHEFILQNITSGIQEKLYRPDITPDIITKLYIAQSLSIIDESLFPRKQFSLELVFNQFLTQFLRGLLTPEGWNIYEEKYKS